MRLSSGCIGYSGAAKAEVPEIDEVSQRPRIRDLRPVEVEQLERGEVPQRCHVPDLCSFQVEYLEFR